MDKRNAAAAVCAGIAAAVLLSGCAGNNGKPSSRQAMAEADYDLTAMNSDMVYATVYQMMAEPEEYIGKTCRMDGQYYSAWYEPTQQYYHYCLIQDAAACCAQGMEFVWEDGNHSYPGDYPQENAEIIVQGTFETYTEEGDSNLYCRLKDAALEVKSEES